MLKTVLSELGDWALGGLCFAVALLTFGSVLLLTAGAVIYLSQYTTPETIAVSGMCSSVEDIQKGCGQ